MRSTRKVLATATLTVVAVLAMSASPFRARAQRAQIDERTAARAHYEKASAAYALGRYADAATEFEQAFALRPDPAILYNAAQANRLAGKKERALELYRNYLRAYGRRAEHASEVDKRITELERAIESERHAPTPGAMSGAIPLVTTEPRVVPAAPRPPPPLPAAPPERPAAPVTLVAPPSRSSPSPSATIATTPSSDTESPIYKRWWFWAGAGAIVAAAVVGIALASRKDADCGGGVDYCANTGL